jgi:hypothetical protein
MSHKRVVVLPWTVCIWLAACSPEAMGDGGTLRFSGPRGGLSVSVFTAPTIVCAGPIDVSVLLLETESGRPITDIPIEVRARQIGREEALISAVATSAAASNKLFQAAQLELPEHGQWRFEILVRTPAALQPIEFDVDVAPALPPLLQLVPWIAWPLVPIGLFGIREVWRGNRARRSHS